MPYDIYLIDKLNKKLAKTDDQIVRRIHKGISDLYENPYQISEQLHGDLKGKRKHREGNLRIEFAICEECRKLGHDTINKCVDCGDMPENALKVFDADFRGAIY